MGLSYSKLSAHLHKHIANESLGKIAEDIKSFSKASKSLDKEDEKISAEDAQHFFDVFVEFLCNITIINESELYYAFVFETMTHVGHGNLKDCFIIPANYDKLLDCLYSAVEFWMPQLVISQSNEDIEIKQRNNTVYKTFLAIFGLLRNFRNDKEGGGIGKEQLNPIKEHLPKLLNLYYFFLQNGMAHIATKPIQNITPDEWSRGQIFFGIVDALRDLSYDGGYFISEHSDPNKPLNINTRERRLIIKEYKGGEFLTMIKNEIKEYEDKKDKEMEEDMSIECSEKLFAQLNEELDEIGSVKVKPTECGRAKMKREMEELEKEIRKAHEKEKLYQKTSDGDECK